MEIVTIADAVKRIHEVGPIRAYDQPILPGTIFDGPHDGETVEQALERRGNIRIGLGGLVMRHLPSGKKFACTGSIWNKESRLELYVHRGGDPGYLPKKVASWECVLLEAWPLDYRSPCRMRPFGGGSPVKKSAKTRNDRNIVGFVYFVYDEVSGCVKIGHTKNLEQRLKSFQTANPNPIRRLGAIPGSREIESQIHDHFRRWRSKGEWFRATDEVLVQIDSIIQDGWPIP